MKTFLIVAGVIVALAAVGHATGVVWLSSLAYAIAGVALSAYLLSRQGVRDALKVGTKKGVSLAKEVVKNFVAASAIVAGTALFLGAFGGDFLQMAGGLLLVIFGLLWAIFLNIGPVTRYKSGVQEEEDDVRQHNKLEDVDPAMRGFRSTLWGTIALEYFLGLVLWKFTGDMGLKGNDFLQTWAAGLFLISAIFWWFDKLVVKAHDPVQVVVVMFLWMRILWCFKPEGLRHFPGRLLGIFRPIFMDVRVVDFDIGGKDDGKGFWREAFRVTTPDGANSKLDLELTIRIVDPITVQNNSDIAGVLDQLYNMMGARLREWAINEHEGPADWFDLKKSRIYALNTIARRLFGAGKHGLPHIDDAPPTEFLLRYVTAPGWVQTPWDLTKGERKKLWEEYAKEYEAYSQSKKDRIEGELKGRRKKLQALQEGTATFWIPSLGIAITRISITDIVADEKVEGSAQELAIEQRERLSQEVELKFTEERIDALVAKGYTRNQASRIVLLSTGKLKSEEKVFTLDATEGGERAAAGLGATVSAVLKGLGRGQEGSKS